jgi:co-chaperonin GroES (HSP10)
MLLNSKGRQEQKEADAAYTEVLDDSFKTLKNLILANGDHLVLPVKVEQTAGKIIIPGDTKSELFDLCRIIKSGPPIVNLDGDGSVDNMFKVGDIIMCGKKAGFNIVIEGKWYKIVRDREHCVGAFREDSDTEE